GRAEATLMGGPSRQRHHRVLSDRVNQRPAGCASPRMTYSHRGGRRLVLAVASVALAVASCGSITPGSTEATLPPTSVPTATSTAALSGPAPQCAARDQR